MAVTAMVIRAGSTGSPFSVSLPSTLPAVPPVRPFSGVALKSSSSASMTGGATMTVAVAVSQLVGFRTSQIV